MQQEVSRFESGILLKAINPRISGAEPVPRPNDPERQRLLRGPPRGLFRTGKLTFFTFSDRLLC